MGYWTKYFTKQIFGNWLGGHIWSADRTAKYRAYLKSDAWKRKRYVVLKRDISSHFLPLMYAEDESVEAFVHKKYPILGVMFHPERDFKDNVIKNYFNNDFYKNIINFLKER